VLQEDEELNFDKTIGILPGAFKPPHRGHFLTAKNACEECDIVFILMSPTSRELGKASKNIAGPESQKYAGLLPGGKQADDLMTNLHIELAEVDRQTSASSMRARIASYGLELDDNITFLKNIKDFLPDLPEEDMLQISGSLITTLKDGIISANEAAEVWKVYVKHLDKVRRHTHVIFDITAGSPIGSTYELCEQLNQQAEGERATYNVRLYTGE